MRDLREIAPVVLFAPPRTWEGIHAEIEIRINDTSTLKRWMFRKLMPIATKVEEKKLGKDSISWIQKGVRYLAEVIILRKLRDYFGLSNLLYAYTGGAAMGPDVILFFRALGINIKQIYGQSETSGIAVVHRNDDVKLETVGKPLKGIELDIAPSGEIRVKGDSIFLGYYENEEETARVLKDGYLYTGDYGHIDGDKHLVVIDRLKEMMKTSEGIDFSPQFIETKMKFSPYIREAVAIGNRKPYIVVLIQIDMQVVGNWAERRNIPYTTFSDLTGKPEVYRLIEEEFRKISVTIPKPMRPKKFALLRKELDPELGDITYTQKIKRGNVMERNKELVEVLYVN
jgi:long-chain acyl-CoA synthetase